MRRTRHWRKRHDVNIFFYVNWEKENVRPVVNEWIRAVDTLGLIPVFLEKDAEFVQGISEKVRFVCEPVTAETDFVLTFGGDGTMIRALDRYAVLDCPFLGVNLGRMGFLLEAEEHKAKASIEALVHSCYTIEKRMMLALETGEGRSRRTALAMNEVSISRGMSQRMIAMDVICERQIVEHYIADGVIVSTPTGSTAYSLAAGGPIIMPDVECILINPICPHTLTSRPIILSKDKQVEVTLNMKEERKGSILSVDGETICSLDNGDSIRVSRAECSAKLVRLSESRNFFRLVKEKLSISTL